MLSRVMDRVLVVGAGITGAVTASMLRQKLPDKCQIEVWDKAGGTGGRMSTSRSPLDDKCTVDLGAQYISAEPPDYEKHKSIYQELEQQTILQHLKGVIEGDKVRPEGTKNFIPPLGMGSIVKYFLNKSDAQLKCNHRIEEIQQEGNHLVVKTEKGTSEMFDGVILTLPVPQILQLKGSLPEIIESQRVLKNNLEAVEYSSRFALGLFFDPGTHIDVPWCAKYFKEDPIIVFVSIDNKKRGQESDSVGPSVLVHTSVPFSLQHLEEDKNIVCLQHVLPQVLKLLPQLPKPVAMKNHKWQYSQVFKSYEGCPGAVVIQDQPLVMCGGDIFTRSGFDGCIESATSIVATVTEKMKQAQL